MGTGMMTYSAALLGGGESGYVEDRRRNCVERSGRMALKFLHDHSIRVWRGREKKRGISLVKKLSARFIFCAMSV
jgi:hypothetical protein